MGRGHTTIQRCQPQGSGGHLHKAKIINMNTLKCHLRARKQEHSVSSTPGLAAILSPPSRRLRCQQTVEPPGGWTGTRVGVLKSCSPLPGILSRVNRSERRQTTVSYNISNIKKFRSFSRQCCFIFRISLLYKNNHESGLLICLDFIGVAQPCRHGHMRTRKCL